MDPSSAFSFAACCNAIAGDMAKALAERHGEAPGQTFARLQAAVHMIMGFLPRDVIETMLASHCVMFHELMLDGLRDRYRTQERKAIRAETLGVLALNKAICGNLGHLERYQTRLPEGRREGAGAAQEGAELGPRPAADTGADTPAAPDGPSQAPAVEPVMSKRDEAPAAHCPPAATTAAPPATPGPASGANRVVTPAAAAALEAGNAAAFAQAMGIENPSEAFLAAANAPGSPFNPRSSGPWPETPRPDKPKP